MATRRRLARIDETFACRPAHLQLRSAVLEVEQLYHASALTQKQRMQSQTNHGAPRALALLLDRLFNRRWGAPPPAAVLAAIGVGGFVVDMFIRPISAAGLILLLVVAAPWLIKSFRPAWPVLEPTAPGTERSVAHPKMRKPEASEQGETALRERAQTRVRPAVEANPSARVSSQADDKPVGQTSALPNERGRSNESAGATPSVQRTSASAEVRIRRFSEDHSA